jgi:hypothetical protein
LRTSRIAVLMTHPGVGPITALATEVFLGDAARFADSKALASHWWATIGESICSPSVNRWQHFVITKS